jgi:hypothetical protein
MAVGAEFCVAGNPARTADARQNNIIQSDQTPLPAATAETQVDPDSLFLRPRPRTRPPPLPGSPHANTRGARADGPIGYAAAGGDPAIGS